METERFHQGFVTGDSIRGGVPDEAKVLSERSPCGAEGFYLGSPCVGDGVLSGEAPGGDGFCLGEAPGGRGVL